MLQNLKEKNMDYSEVRKVIEETIPERVNEYLKTGRWAIIGVAPGQSESGDAYCLYALGWYGNYSENDDSEFPVPELPKGSWAEFKEIL